MLRRRGRPVIVASRRDGADTENVLQRLDAVVDRLEGVYERLRPFLAEPRTDDIQSGVGNGTPS